MKVAPSPVGREAGRGLLTLANLITVVAPVAADWNDSHIFNRRWPSHAAFTGWSRWHDQYAGRSQPVVVVVALD